MSDVATGAPPAERLLSPVTAAVLVAVGISCFVATLVLGAYAPDFKGSGRAGGHAASRSFNGYAGLVRLAEATGRHPRVTRDVHLLATEDLVVATPEDGGVNVDPVMGQRASRPTLLVLPKWSALPDPRHRGWAMATGLLPVGSAQGVLAPAARLSVVHRRSGGRPLRTIDPTMTDVSFAAPTPLQAIRPDAGAPGQGDAGYGALEPLIVDERSNIVLGKFANRPLYVLADPDLLDNRGMKDSGTAVSALAMLDDLNSNEAGGIAFDVTLNGLAGGRSPLKLLFEPPFLATTLCLAAAILLAALTTLTRFGSPRPRGRAIAFGKAALVDNTAALVGKARAETRLGGRYADVIREAAVRAFALPARLRGAELDGALDRLERGPRPFTALAGELADARTSTDMVGAARALHRWMRTNG